MTNAQIETAVRQRQAARLVDREVNCCLSSMVSTLMTGNEVIDPHKGRGAGACIDLAHLCYAAAELASPVFDYESAAREAGWRPDRTGGGNAWVHDVHDYLAVDPEDACQKFGVEPHELEVYEHWAVSTWLADKLIAKGERVDTDFAGLNVWARTTTGQAISIDSVIEAIVAETGYASAGA